MANLLPWFHVVQPREDLRDGKPLDASEFAVHLDHVRDSRAPEAYQNPALFFERNYMTRTLHQLAAEVIRRLSGETLETSAVFNMTTQFGGGKTHALTLLFHLARAGGSADGWKGVAPILEAAGLSSTPSAATAVFVGTEFDSLTGRGGEGGEPHRRTPWGEIAWQLGGQQAFEIVAEHDREFVEPKGDVIRSFLPKDRPCLILMDEIINYVSTYRSKGYNDRLFNFIQSLSEVSRGEERIALVVSIPASELEYTVEDQADEQRFKKMLDRVGKPMIMSAETETAEIVRHRLFEWTELPPDGRKAAETYADWILENKQLIGDFDVGTAKQRFIASYPFHPAVFSVFEGKWQNLPRFQKTRGTLRLLALWVARSYQEGYVGAHKDPLIGLGTAPLHDPYFRAAAFEQLGNSDLEGAVTTDIAGRDDAWALRLDRESEGAIKKARLHQKVATTIFFESNGGQTRAEATVPEIRLAVAEPHLDIANVETALDNLTDTCYYLTAHWNRYRFQVSPNLNKLVIDRRAIISEDATEERVRREIQHAFRAGAKSLTRVFFPTASSDIPDRPVGTLVVLAPETYSSAAAIFDSAKPLISSYGTSPRVFRASCLFVGLEVGTDLENYTRTLLAWEDIADDSEMLKRLDENQLRQLDLGRQKAARDLREEIWRGYRRLVLIGRDGEPRAVDLGLGHSGGEASIAERVLNRLREDDEVTDAVAPSRLLRVWPPQIEAWTTRALRDAFYSSPELPLLLEPAALRKTIADGVSQGLLGYGLEQADGRINPVYIDTALPEADIEISDEAVILRAEDARKHIQPPRLTRLVIDPLVARADVDESIGFTVKAFDQYGGLFPLPAGEWSSSGGSISQDGVFVGKDIGDATIRFSAGDLHTSATVVVAERDPLGETEPSGFVWRGSVPHQKWMNFYTKVLSKFVSSPELQVEVQFTVGGEPIDGQRMDEVRAALKELDLSDRIEPL